MIGFSLHTFCRVYDDSSGEYVQIGEDPDGCGLIALSCGEGTATVIVMPPDQARLVAQAILKIVGERRHA